MKKIKNLERITCSAYAVFCSKCF